MKLLNLQAKLILILLLISFGKLNAQVVINEFSCSNVTTTLDAFNQREDWIELYNSGGAPVNLTGYYLSDDRNNTQKWQIPAVTDITANGRKMIFCSDRNLVHAASGQIHSGFKLRQSYNECFILADPLGNVVDSVNLGSNLTQRNHSRGRTIDGAGTWSIFNTPSPNALNANGKNAYAQKVTFSLPAANYPVAQSITLSHPDPLVTIRYTTNGVTPSATSTIYAGPINVPTTTVIRAIAISSDPLVLPSFIETNTYFINETSTFDIISVSGPFTPASANGGAALFNGGQPIWTSIEYFNNTGQLQFEMDGRASRHGNDSWAFPQKGIDYECLDETGTMSSMNKKLFNTSLRDTFDRIMMKAGGSDNYISGATNAAHIRDVFAQTLAEKYGLEMDFRRWHATLMFVNGEYWGLYDTRERVDGDYFEYYYGKKRDKIDHLSYWGGLNVRLGSDTGWNNLYNYILNNNMAIQPNYEHVKDYLNVKSFIQYFVFNEYLVNHDWLNWNTMWWRARGNNNQVKWKYVLWDEDAITGLTNPNYTGIGTITYQNDPCEASTLFQNDPDVKHTDMLARLLMNPEFEQSYKGEWLHMFNTCFDCTNLLAHYDSCINIITPEMNRQAIRWGGNMADWNLNVVEMRTFLQNRCAVIGQKLDSCLQLNPQNLKLNVSPPNSGTIALDNETKSPYIWSKVIAGDSVYNLKATPTGGQYWAFDHWEKQDATNLFLPNSTTDNISFDFKKKDSVIAFFKYFNYDSVDVTFDVTPAGTGTIKLNGNLIPVYPTTIKLDRRFTYNIESTPNPQHYFVQYLKNNANTTIASVTSAKTTFNYTDKETITAEFKFIPPPPPPPPLPAINKTVFIPNALTPTGDDKNDEFHIKVTADVIGMDMRIFDRWGKLIFRTNEMREGWDGKINGKKCDVGTYQYYIKLRYRDNTEESHKGDITLLK